MNIRLLAIGTSMPNWVDQVVADYQKRIGYGMRFRVQALPSGKRSNKTSAEEAMRLEAKSITQAVGSDYVIMLDEHGKQHDSIGLSRRLAHWRMLGKDVTLLVGGADGFDPSIKAIANEKWSLSKLTLPHPMVRMVVVEQIYRAQTILSGHPYHRA